MTAHPMNKGSDAGVGELIQFAVEFVRTYPKSKREQFLMPAYEDITSMGRPYTEPAAMVWRDRPTTFADCANDLLRALTKVEDTE